MRNDDGYRPWRDLQGDYRSHVRELRRDLTPSERIFWAAVRKRAIDGVRFRRQHPFEGFILDFYALELRLVVEIDGDVHDLPERQRYDAWRDGVLRSHGLMVVRFTNDEVGINLPGVLERLRTAIREAREFQR